MYTKYRKITYGGAMITNEEINAITKSIKKSQKTGNWQSSEEAKKMEEESAKFLGVKYGILTTSGSCAGLLALEALELPKGSEVIISAVTFPTIFNIILQCGLVPVVVDAKVGSYVLDVKDVKKAITKKTKAIWAIHALGNPVDMVSLMELVKGKGIYVLEDNCDGWGSAIGKKKVGSFGDVSITSFHAAHIVTMGVGGGVYTDNPQIAQNVRMYRDWGRQANVDKPHTCPALPKDHNPRFVYDKIGYNFQILELQAAMGRVQLKKSDKIKKLRQFNFNWIYQMLEMLNEQYRFPFIMPWTVKGADVCWFAFPITFLGDRGPLVAHLEKNGIETRSMFAGNIIKHPAYKKSKYRVSGKLDEANYILEHSFWIGVHPRMTPSDRNYIYKVFETFLKENDKTA